MTELKDCVVTVNKGLNELRKSNKFNNILRGVGFGMCGASDIAGFHGHFNQTVNIARNNFMNKFSKISNKSEAIKLLTHTKCLLATK